MARAWYSSAEVPFNTDLKERTNAKVKPSDFHIGMEFTSDADRVRCTDIGQRTIVAIRIDSVSVTTLTETGKQSTRVLNEADAHAQGWFLGPPYAVAEVVFDENDLPAFCAIEDFGSIRE